MRQVPFVNLAAQFAEERDELMPRIEAVLASGMLVGGPEVEALEAEIADYCGVAHAVTVNSGSDALILGMLAAGIGAGDEVITPPNSFVASTSTIVKAGAVPVFADVREDELLDPAAVEAACTPRTVAIMPVHLRGQVCDMDALSEIAERRGLMMIEDAAQSVGSMHRGRKTGALGTVGCFSAHPLKLLNAAGDAGFITTDDASIAEKVRLLRNSGLRDRDTVVEWGTVSRLDAVQAAILRFRLGRLDDVIRRRRRNAEIYRECLADSPVGLPPAPDYEFNTYNTFVIRADRRDDLQRHLTERAVASAVHYGRPLHLQPVAEQLGYRPGQFPVTERLCETILSLPVHQFLADADVRYVAGGVTEFDREPRRAAGGSRASNA